MDLCNLNNSGEKQGRIWQATILQQFIVSADFALVFFATVLVR